MEHQEETNILVLKKHIIKANDDGYRYIIITYNGSGDSGAIEEIYLSKTIDDIRDTTPLISSDREPIESWAYNAILDKISDWYNNDGGYGTIVIDVNDCTYTVENNIRYMEIHMETLNGQV
jgi:hypothetical protein